MSTRTPFPPNASVDAAGRQVGSLLQRMCSGLSALPGDSLQEKAQAFVSDPSSGIGAISHDDRTAMVTHLRTLGRSPGAGAIPAGVIGALADGISATLEPKTKPRAGSDWLAQFTRPHRPGGPGLH
jgi:hypothetical protein